MIKSLIIFTEILQRPKKKNIIFEKITTPRFISIFIFIFTVTPVSTSAVKIRVVIQPHPPRISLAPHSDTSPPKLGLAPSGRDLAGTVTVINYQYYLISH